MDGQVTKKNLDPTRWRKSHINTDDNEFNEALQDQESNVGLYTQDANSPDAYILDLGFF